MKHARRVGLVDRGDQQAIAINVAGVSSCCLPKLLARIWLGEVVARDRVKTVQSRNVKTKPSHIAPETLLAGVAWHQRWEVWPGVFTPGHNDVAHICRATELPENLHGMRVLDIGAWNGCFSFECERRGAAEVVAYSLEHPEETGFRRLKEALGSRVRYVQGSVYDLSSRNLGYFDLILFFGVLYHLRYPLLGIDRLRSVCRGTVLVETHVVRDRLLLRGRRSLAARLLGLSRWFDQTPIWRQYGDYELHPQDRSNWFGPNVPAVVESFESAGFATNHLCSWGDRASFRARLQPKLLDRFTNGSYEGLAAVCTPLTGLLPPVGGLLRKEDS